MLKQLKSLWKKAAKLLCEEFKTIENLINAQPEDIIKIDGFGTIVAQSVVDYFRKDKDGNIGNLSGNNNSFQSSIISSLR